VTSSIEANARAFCGGMRSMSPPAGSSMDALTFGYGCAVMSITFHHL
jgi:hypothetical protein